MKITAFFVAAFLAVLYACQSKPSKPADDPHIQKGTVTIAAASDLKFAMDSLISIFAADNPSISVSVIYGSSGKFFQQITKDAPFDLYFSADVNYARKLEQMGLTAGEPRIYAIGRLVLWSSRINTEKGMASLLDNRVNKIAMANPAHAPYGQRAEEVLRYYKIYPRLKSRLVLGENISQTAQYVSSGAAEIGIIALSLALSPTLRRQGTYFLIPDSAHHPLEQAYVVLKKAAGNKPAFLFSEFISSEQARNILKKYGFTLPE